MRIAGWKYRAVAVALALIAAGPGCTAPPLAPTASPMGTPIEFDSRTQLALAERRWADRGPRNYDFTVRIGCIFCFGDRIVRFYVRDGVSTAPDATSATLERFRLLSSVDMLFAQIHQILDRHPFRFDADYDSTSGYPTLYWVDYDFYLQDEEYSVSVSDFVPR